MQEMSGYDGKGTHLYFTWGDIYVALYQLWGMDRHGGDF